MTLPTPLAELHVHVEGTLEPELVFALADRNRVELPWASIEELRREYDFQSLSDFLDLYFRCMDVLRTREDFRDLMIAYLRRAVAGGVAHAEVFFDPQAHRARGVSIDTVMDGLLDGMQQVQSEADLTGGLILCFLRDRPVSDAEETFAAVRHRLDDLIGIGLDSAEVGFPPELFSDLFARARAQGLRIVAHAGEEAGPGYIWSALKNLGAERIDHGVAAEADSELTAYLADNRIPLTMCPLSNQRLQVTPDLHSHPARLLLETGVVITANSDDPAYFGGYIDDNLRAIADACAFSADELRTLALNSINASFATPERKADLRHRLEEQHHA